jgi:hypothetical protein
MIEQLSEQKKMTLNKLGHLVKWIESVGLLLVVVFFVLVKVLLLGIFLLLAPELGLM